MLLPVVLTVALTVKLSSPGPVLFRQRRVGRDSSFFDMVKFRSMLEAIDACERITGRRLEWTYSETARTGDHRWWVSDLSSWERDYPDWKLRYDVDDILQAIYDVNVERWDEDLSRT